jgi:phosphoserine aminotransferase
MSEHIYNFNPGPAILPEPVLKRVRDELQSFNGTGISILETSHRSKDFEQVNNDAHDLMLKLMGLGDDYTVLFMGGGASLQFAMVPMNFLDGGTADYVNTGSWSKKAIKEAKLFGNVKVAGSSEEANFTFIPKESDLRFSSDAHYVHLTSNNTIFGTQWHAFPKTKGVPVVCDMSSDILSRKVDFGSFDLIYAGAQKNLGPAGVTAVIIKRSFLETAKAGLTSMLSYKTYAEKKSLYNTPPVFGIYIVKLVLEWIAEAGGIDAVEKVNRKKQQLLYDFLDQNEDFYRGTAQKDSRSMMNVTFRLPSEEKEKDFVAKAAEQGMIGLKGHRSVGGIRASIYNAFPFEGVERLVEFMKKFRS